MTTRTLFLILSLCIGFLNTVQSFAITRSTGILITSKNDFSFSINAGFGKTSEPVTKTKIPPSDELCACKSGKAYGECCKPYHDGLVIATNPIAVIRSRFSGLSYAIVDYIMKTTHPDHKDYCNEEQVSKMKKWVKDLNSFCERYKFLDLIFDDENAGLNPLSDEVIVSFTAKLQKIEGDRPVEDLKEKSVFKKTKEGKWLYADAELKGDFRAVKGDTVKPKQRAVTTVRKGVPKGNQG